MAISPRSTIRILCKNGKAKGREKGYTMKNATVQQSTIFEKTRHSEVRTLLLVPVVKEVCTEDKKATFH
jgi:hypothetical protein